MHFQDLDVVIGQRLGGALHQRRQQVDAQAHIAGLDDHGMARRRLDARFVFGGKAGGADDMDDARLRRQIGQHDRDHRAW